MKVLAVVNQKGGVGKSTITVHIGFEGAERELKTAVIDLDGQGNTSKTLSAFASGKFASELFKAPVEVPNQLDMTVIQADGALNDLEREDPQIILQFKKNIEALEQQGFDLVVIDTPPTLGLRMTAAMIVATHAISPIELETYSIDGITKMLQAIFGVKEQYNQALEFIGMLPNRFNHLSKNQKDTFVTLLTEYAQLMIPAKLGTRTAIPEATTQGKPVWKLKKGAAAGAEMKKALKVIFEKMGDGV